MWLPLRLIKDSSGYPSWTLTLGVPAVILLTAWFLVGGIDLTVGPVHILTATKGAAEYSLAVGVWLTYLAQKGWRDKGTAPAADPAAAAAPPAGGKPDGS